MRVNDLDKRLQVHTSDRSLYKRCRRKWDWGSQMRQAYIPKAGNGPISMPFWFGSGFHYAMEDFHGYNKHGNLLNAFDYYIEESKKAKNIPVEWEEARILADGMFNHYLRWQKGRDKFETVWLDGKPLVELEFHIPLPERVVGRPNVTYSGVIDRVVKDEWNHIWLLDYKTAKVFDTAKLEQDPQVSAYMFAAKHIFNLDVEGMVYWQFKKEFPHPPALLKTGKFSLNKTQKTTYDLFKDSIKLLFGDSPRWRVNHPEYIEYLNYLADQEGTNYDKYIRMDLIRRSDHHLNSVYDQIIMEAVEMANPELPIYPNPTKDCSWDCQFRSACVAKDDGSDYQSILDASFEQTTIEERNPYRDKEEWASADPDAYLNT